MIKKIGIMLMVAVLAVTSVTASAATYYTEADINTVAKLIYGEARGVNSLTEMSGVAWCVLNRVDAGYANGTIQGVIKAKGQFSGYSSKNPITSTCYNVAKDVLERWEAEKMGQTNVYRTLPREYKYFSGYKGHNRFRKEYNSKGRWNWSLPSPYVS